MEKPREIELLAPAANADVAIQAILHGADAVYIGPASHGARRAAANSAEDIRRVVEFAHPFDVKVYATVNTIVYDRELKDVEHLIRQLYLCGVDALIVQDMGILRLDLPPIQLHASTQCDTRTPEKARFLQDVGFSQIVLARELTLTEISNICRSVDVPVECFIHGALCVSYSGRCHASQAFRGRSANRGECAQICRLPFTLKDADGKVITANRHLLSLKDFNLSDRLESLLDAGVSSFKIEGRLKDADYVKNIVALYRRKIDEIITKHPDKYRRSSFGESEISFTPQADKSFNRGFTHYFIDERRPKEISSPLTPKSMGETISDPSQLHNGDGISFFNAKNEYEGVMVNGVHGKRIVGNREFRIPAGSKIHRTFDIQWQKTMAKPTAIRRIALNVKIDDSCISAGDERGVAVTLPLPHGLEEARQRKPLRDMFDKFGNTIYRLNNFDDSAFTRFIPASVLADLRRRMLQLLDRTAVATYSFEYRRKEDFAAQYPSETLDFRDNVSNKEAEAFYRSHGVKKMERSMEATARGRVTGKRVMTTRHCILRELGKCLKTNPSATKNIHFPLTLTSGDIRMTAEFDCSACEMHLFS